MALNASDLQVLDIKWCLWCKIYNCKCKVLYLLISTFQEYLAEQGTICESMQIKPLIISEKAQLQLLSWCIYQTEVQAGTIMGNLEEKYHWNSPTVDK